jgi:hypothetical protein
MEAPPVAQRGGAKIPTAPTSLAEANSDESRTEDTSTSQDICTSEKSQSGNLAGISNDGADKPSLADLASHDGRQSDVGSNGVIAVRDNGSVNGGGKSKPCS